MKMQTRIYRRLIGNLKMQTRIYRRLIGNNSENTNSGYSQLKGKPQFIKLGLQGLTDYKGSGDQYLLSRYHEFQG